jgi:type II secretory pathway component PulJ
VIAVRRRLRGVAQTGETGLSLTELIVAMMVFAMLLAMVGGFIVSAGRANQLNRNLTTTNGAASTAMNEVSRMLRGAVTHPVSGQQLDDPAFISVASNAISFYTSVNLSGSTANMLEVSYSLTGTTLMESIYQPSSVDSNGYYTFGSAPTTTRALAYNIVTQANGGPALFSYVDGTNAAMAQPSSNLLGIAAVTVSIQVGAANSTTQSTLLTDTVGLPNINVARNPS